MALPAMHRVARLARRTGCVSNMRQMYAAFATYANQFDEELPKSTMEYYRIRGLFDSVDALDPYIEDARAHYCTVRDIGPLPDIDDRVGGGGTYVGWNHHDQPYATHVLSNIAMFFNPAALTTFGVYDDNLWPTGKEWREPKAPLVAHRRIMRYDLKHWDAADWRCQNWYPHGPYHDVIFGAGRCETHSKALWQAKPRLWFQWGGAVRHNIFY
jgi:hypothetical protein